MAAQGWTPVPADESAWTPVAEDKPAPQPEGLIHSLAAQFGLTKEQGQAAHDEIMAHPLKAAAKAALGPAGALVEGLYNQAKQSAGQVGQAYQAAKSGNLPLAAVNAVQAIPIVGPAMSKAADQYADKNYMGEAGTLTGAAAQAAPVVLGATDAAIPDRPVISSPTLPSKAKAITVFNDLNTKLAGQPVDLNATLAPLQRATEIGVRGGTLPKAVSDLLTRSQATEPMTFPEARDYQMALTDLSRADAESISPRMKAQIGQINQALFSDISAAADQHTPGLSSNYAYAMREYRHAAQISNVLNTAKTQVVREGVKGFAKGVGMTAAAGAGYQIYKETQK